ENPIPVLEEILQKMQTSFASMEEQKKSFIVGEGRDILVKQMKYETDLNLFQNEINRFSHGISILKKYEKTLDAFKLMNKAFMKSAKGYASWRLFQIIFIVMNIPDVAKSEYEEIEADPEVVDVIYFPTGGGKTEAYLGLVVFTAFFDRLRGKFAGVTAFTKFPLRLLSLQQLQRIADIFAKAELVRREHPEINSGKNEPFSMGYYVGKSNTPNILIKKDDWGSDEDHLSPLIDNEEEREKLLIISKCPFCESKEHKVKIKPDLDNIRLLHVCENPACKEEILPVYISDVEVYRYIPTFIVGTLDKIPTCGYQSNFRNIFGQVKHKCPKHGYMSSEKCSEIRAGCTVPVENYEEVELYDPTPTLQIQDEMHLIRESFGSFDAHYETYLMNLQKRIGGKPIKVIAATATINDDFHIQVKHLYGREKTSRFPSSGPNRKESFYSLEDPEGKLSRIIVGLLPHNKTIRFSVIDLIKYFTQIVRKYWEEPDKLLSDKQLDLKSPEDVYELLKDYTTILEYNLAKRDGAAINQSVGTMINPFLKKADLLKEKGMNFVSMTGDVRFRDVRAVLDKLENFDKKPEIDLITATSMISHGVDIDSLNFMVFHGMPGNTAEYVQAYSRVGRKHPGIVFIVLNPTRERDQSYYKYFQKFHEFQDLLVESVPINRWAKFSISRTLPGIFTSALMHYFDLREGCNKLYMTKGFQEAYQTSKLNDKEIKEFLLESYQTKEDDLGNNFKQVIEKTVSQYIDQILQCKNSKFIPMFISDPPMTSLRDIDEQVDIKITPESAPAMIKIAGVTESNGGEKQ
ncbi:helicase SNF2, partial [Candidatus Woesearchaeota archaeon]|nr:helicase SNF2 [Candidatus Woesearchaeota archaeon]